MKKAVHHKAAIWSIFVPKIKPKDLSGTRFGKLVVLDFFDWKVQPSGQRKALWRCACDCGEITVCTSSNLKSGHTSSCGCLFKEAIKTHGLSKTPEYKIFEGIIARCNNPKASYYSTYGGSGVKVEGDWALPYPYGFLNFYNDMGKRPSDKHTIERLDVTKGYSKDNCIWTDDMSLQSYNRSMDKRNKSGRTGVRFDFERNQWYASIGYKNKTIFLGRYKLFEDAVKAREEAEIKYYGFTKE